MIEIYLQVKTSSLTTSLGEITAQKCQTSPWGIKDMFFNVPTLCMLSIKTLSVGSTVFVNQMVSHTSTSSCVIDLRNQSTKCPHARKPACSHLHWTRSRRSWSQVRAHEMSTWKLERRPVAFQLVKFLLGHVRSVRFKKLRNSQFTTKAVPTLQDLVKKTNLFCDSEMYRRQQTSE